MRYSFTGPHRGFRSHFHSHVLFQVISRLEDATEFTTGAAYGVDSMCAIIAHKIWPEAKHRIVVPAGEHNRKLVDALEKTSNYEIIEMEPGSSYRDRNVRLVEFCDILIAFPLGKLEQPGSGTWMTVNIAKREAKEHKIYHLTPFSRR